MVPTKNTVDLDRRLPDSQLVIYPDAGHGGVFQFHEDFVKRALEFLERMKAYLVDKYKARCRPATAAEPTVGDRDVLVDIHAAGVNMLDAKIRDGDFKLVLPYKTPFILGHDLAGVVTRVGSAVTRFTVGDEVYGRRATTASAPSPSASPCTRTISRSSPRASPWPRRPRCPSWP